MKDRIRVHHFSAKDIQQELRPYGITRNHIPDRLGGTVNEKAIIGWFQWRTKLESKRYAFLRQSAPDNSPMSTPTIDEVKGKDAVATEGKDRAELLKRTMDEVYWHNKIAMEHRRIKKLKEEQTALREEGDTLEAFSKWIEEVAAHHARQRSMIMEHLGRLLKEPTLITQIKGMPDSLMNEQGSIDFSIDHGILDCFEYLGRHSSNGLFMFQTTASVNQLDPKNRLLMDFLLARIPLDLFGNNADLASNVLVSTDDDLEDTENWQQFQDESNEEFRARIEHFVQNLRARNANLQKENGFLCASVKLTNAVEAGYESYQKDNTDSIARLVNSVMHSNTGIDLESVFHASHYMHPRMIAGRLLASNFLWMGCHETRHFSAASVEIMLRAGGYLSPIIPDISQSVPQHSSECYSRLEAATAASKSDSRSILSADERRRRVKSRRKRHLRRL